MTEKKIYKVGDDLDSYGKILHIFSQDDSEIPTSYIVFWDDYKKYITFIDGYCHWFGVDWIPEDHLEWFCEILTRQLMESYNHGCKQQKDKINNCYKDFISAIDKPMSWRKE